MENDKKKIYINLVVDVVIIINQGYFNNKKWFF